MHEISLVENLLAQLRELAAGNGATKINSVTMEIGPMSGVVIDSFQFGFDTLCADEELFRNSKLIITETTVDFRCTECGHVETTTGSRPDGCPNCAELLLIPNGGDDLLLNRVEME